MSLLSTRDHYKPFYDASFFEKWLIHEKAAWLPEEVPMLGDIDDWNHRLKPTQKEFLTHIFRFFVQGDIDVAGGYATEFIPMFKHPEIRMMLLGFASREAVHIHAYSYLIETLGLPEVTYSQFLEYEAMRNKHAYIANIKHKKDKESLAKKIAIFSAFTEGMQLFSSFIMLLNFKRFGLMKGMGTIIQWSINDETQHFEGMLSLFRKIIEEDPGIWTDEFKAELYQVARDMVALEDAFIDLAFATGGIEGLTADETKAYIRYIANRRLNSLGLKDNWEMEENPLPWVEEMLIAPSHTNFFEDQVTDYARLAVTGSWAEVFPR